MHWGRSQLSLPSPNQLAPKVGGVPRWTQTSSAQVKTAHHTAVPRPWVGLYKFGTTLPCIVDGNGMIGDIVTLHKPFWACSWAVLQGCACAPGDPRTSVTRMSVEGSKMGPKKANNQSFQNQSWTTWGAHNRGSGLFWASLGHLKALLGPENP